MNVIKIKIDFENGTNTIVGNSLISGDYASTKLEFEFDTEEGIKIFEMKNPKGEVVIAKEIEDNELLLAGVDENEEYYSLFEEGGIYTYEISLYVDGTKLTSAKGEIPVKQEQVVINGEVIEPYLPLFDELMQEINTALTQTDNLNIDGSKTGKITTITITYKDGTTKELQLEDGKSIEYNWQGTQLGIRQEGQSEYVYVDLKGEKGEPGAIKIIIVAELPSTGADDTIYLVPITPDVSGNNYAEYIYINGAWELLGKIGVQVDLTDYVKFTDIASDSKAGVMTTSGTYATGMSGSSMYAVTRNYATYQTMANGSFIGKGTLENVITGKGLVSNTNYANASTGGVIKASNYYDTEIDSSGALRSKVVSYAGYPNESNNAFISKGTLDNVLNAKIGDIDSVLDAINGEVI